MTVQELLRPASRTSIPRTVARVVLGGFLLLAGVGHLTFARDAFQAQVPTWLPLDADFIVLASGVVEIVLGLALLILGRWRVPVGWIVAVFFVAVFPGNLSQFTTATDSFGLNTDLTRGIRLLFQPLLVLWALWATGAWRAFRAARAERAAGRERTPRA
ncbi:putative membrane protein [Mycetocola sp. CAN_C7]|uniref:DoxX family protein n=1 Tax=Mycetocola sp. CAN_C7 TaxID=2787724 RepID=UPI0018CA7A7C